MPEIKVKIVRGSTEVSSKATEVASNSLTDLLASLKAAKEDANAVMTKLVEDSKDGKQTRKSAKSDDDDEEESSEDDTENAKKRQKS